MDVMSMEQRLVKSVAPRLFQMLSFGDFAALALLIAMVGGAINFPWTDRIVHKKNISTPSKNYLETYVCF
jgi:hypothetical protein